MTNPFKTFAIPIPLVVTFLLAVVPMGFTVGIAWSDVNGGVVNNADDIVELAATLEKHEELIERQQDQLTRQTIQNTRTITNQENILRILERLERDIDKLSDE